MLGADDPRNRRSGQALAGNQRIIGAGLGIDAQGRIVLDPPPGIGNLADVDQSVGRIDGAHLRYDDELRKWVPVLASVRRTPTAADYAALTTDELIAVTSTAAARTITLPKAASMDGRVVVVKDESGGAAANNITVDGNGAETVDGGGAYTISTNYGVARLYCNGAAWFSM